MLGLRCWVGYIDGPQVNVSWHQIPLDVIVTPSNLLKNYRGLVNVPFWGFGSHHFQVSVGDYIPNIWVMFN